MIGRYKILRLTKAGDTIVEVLFCVTVISGTLLATYKSINHAYSSFQDNQEHSWAIKLVDTQTDELYIYARNHPGFTWSSGGCFKYDGAGNITTASGSSCTVGPNGQTGGTPTPAYQVSISGPVSQTYTTTASWTGLSGNESVSIVYRPPR